MGWATEWRERCRQLEERGLPVRVLGVLRHGELVVLELEADDALLPRTATQRGRPLCVPLAFADDADPERVEILHARWAGRAVRLAVDRAGRTSATLRETDELALDSDLQEIRCTSYNLPRPHIWL